MFKKNKEKDYIIIAGCGQLGSKIAEEMSNERKSIVVIDKNEKAFQLISDNFSGFKYIYNVPIVVARVYETERHDVYKKLGINTISPIQLSSHEFKKIITDRENNQ